MSRKPLLLGVASLVAVGLVPISASAQHHDGGHHGGGHHGGGHQAIGSHHRGVNFGHNDWNYVVPHRTQHHGAYYVQQDAHYYTPAPVVHVQAPARTASFAPVHVESPVRLEFGGFARHEDLAGRLSFEANQLCLDLHHNYRHNPGYRQVYSEAYQLLMSAKYLHSAEHANDREEVRRRAAEMDQAYHHLREELAGWSRDHHRQVGSGDAIEKASAVEAALHHLCYDVGVEPHQAPIEEAPPAEEELAPPPG